MPRSNARIQLPKEAYPENSLSERIEKKILDTLPVLQGLDHAKCKNERLAILQLSVAVAYLQFTSHTADPFGCDLLDDIPVSYKIKNILSWVTAQQSARNLLVF